MDVLDQGGGPPVAIADTTQFVRVGMTNAVLITDRVHVSKIVSGQNAEFTLTLSLPAPADGLSVTYDLTQFHSDFNSGGVPTWPTFSRRTVRFPPDSTQRTVSVPISGRDSIPDRCNNVSLLVEGDGCVQMSIVDSSSGRYRPHPAYSNAFASVSNQGTPQLTIMAGPSPITEGETASFTVKSNVRVPSEGMTITVDVSQQGSHAVETLPTVRTMIMDGGSMEASLEVPTQADAIDEREGAIIATIGLGNGYVTGFPAEARVIVQDPELGTGTDSLGFTQEFVPNSIRGGGTSRLTFQISNGGTMEASDLSFTHRLPDGVTVRVAPKVDTGECGGFLGVKDVSGVRRGISYSGGRIAAKSGAVDATCTISIAVTSDVSGTHVSPAVDLTSSLDDSRASARASSTILRVIGPPGFSKRFDPVSIAVDGVSTLIFTIDNSASVIPATGLAFTDVFRPSTLTIADPAKAASTCVGGDLTAVPGQVTIGYSRGTVAAEGICTIRVNVTSDAEGAHENVSGDLTSSGGNSGKATATLWVASGKVVSPTRIIVRKFMSKRADTLTVEEPSLFKRLTERYADGRGNPLGFAAGGEPKSLNMSFRTSLGALYAQSRTDKLGTLAEIKRSLKTVDDDASATGADGGVLAADAGIYAPPPEYINEERPTFDIWAEGKYARVRNASWRSDAGLFWLGADYLANPDLVLGVVGQMDWTDLHDRAGNGKAEGFGWMAGPYVVARLLDNLIFDGRGAMGTSTNKVNPFGRYVDDFKTTRWLVRGQLTGEFDLDGLAINPFVRVLYFDETQHTYTDRLGNRIPKQTVSLGRMKFGPKLSGVFVGWDALVFSPHVTLSGLFDFDRAGRIGSGERGAQGGSRSRLRGRIEGGLRIIMREKGWQLNGEGFYDGVGRRAFESYGGSLSLVVPFAL